jgi:L-threonylcarbamoyladenylate synthase
VTVLPFRSDDDVRAAIPVVKEHVSRGGFIVYPTETVYGLGSRPVAADVAALAALKNRPSRKPFLLLVSSRQMAEAYGLVFPRAADAMAEQFWPGPLTLVLPGGEGKLPDSLRGAEGGIAVRWTSHHGTATLITALDMPITSTSANRPGERTPPGVDAVAALFPEEIAAGRVLILDGGVLGNVPPSTLVDCTGPVPRLVRPGAIPLQELRARLGRLAP